MTSGSRQACREKARGRGLVGLAKLAGLARARARARARAIMAMSAIALLMTATGSQAQDQAVQARVGELVECLSSVMGSDSGHSLDVYSQLSATGDDSVLMQACAERRGRAYEPENMASYAMGVSFQSKVLDRFDSLNWVDFLNGLLRAEGGSVKISQGALDRVLKTTLMGPTEASQQYLDTLRENAEYQESSGVFYRALAGQEDLSEEAESPIRSAADDAGNLAVFQKIDRENHGRTWVSAFDEPGVCEDTPAGNSAEQRVRFHRVKPIYTKIESVQSVGQNVDCVGFNKDDVIRGWRLLLGQLEPEMIYDVLVPSELAYGATGVPGFVDGGEHLRFLMRFDH